MRRKFLTWLLLLVCATFIVTGGLAYMQFNRQAQGRAEQVLTTRLNDLAELISYTNANMRHVEEINNESTLNRTRAVAELLRLNPSFLTNNEALQRICNELGADQLCVADEQGYVIAAAPMSLVGFDLNSHDQSRPFLKCIHRPGEELVQRPRKNAFSGDVIQYAGVSRRDEPGVVQLGFKFMHEQAVRANTAFAALADRFKLGKNGHIIAFNGGALLNGSELSYQTADLLSIPLDKTTRISLADKVFFASAIQKGDIRIIGLLPEEEINVISLESLRQLFISNIWLFIVMFLLVWVLLQKLVLNGLSRINSSLQRITEGYKEERVNVRDTPEFTRLSTGINTMVDSLQAYAEHRRERLQRELTMARSVQDTVLPNQFPAFPDQTSFDLFAARMQAEGVGGDFHDYFMADNEHLCFMLGDVSTTGMPGALFMMRALSVIRSLAASGLTPAELLTEANRVLCENNVTKTRISFFFARLNIKSGVLRFINAGTPQALKCVHGGQFEMMPMRSGTVLAAYKTSIYRECVVQLHPGDRILLYSQGVLKATDAARHPYGATRLQEALKTQTDNVTDLVRGVQMDMRMFTGNKEQSLDSTLLALEFKGKWMQKKDFALRAGDADALYKLTTECEQLLELVFASPLAITEIQGSIADIISTIPEGTDISLALACNEEEAEIRIHYPLTDFNPLYLLPHLSPEHYIFSTNPPLGSTITILKSLA